MTWTSDLPRPNQVLPWVEPPPSKAEVRELIDEVRKVLKDRPTGVGGNMWVVDTDGYDSRVVRIVEQFLQEKGWVTRISHSDQCGDALCIARSKESL